MLNYRHIKGLAVSVEGIPVPAEGKEVETEHPVLEKWLGKLLIKTEVQTSTPVTAPVVEEKQPEVIEPVKTEIEVKAPETQAEEKVEVKAEVVETQAEEKTEVKTEETKTETEVKTETKAEAPAETKKKK